MKAKLEALRKVWREAVAARDAIAKEYELAEVALSDTASDMEALVEKHQRIETALRDHLHTTRAAVRDTHARLRVATDAVLAAALPVDEALVELVLKGASDGV